MYVFGLDVITHIQNKVCVCIYTNHSGTNRVLKVTYTHTCIFFKVCIQYDISASAIDPIFEMIPLPETQLQWRRCDAVWTSLHFCQLSPPYLVGRVSTWNHARTCPNHMQVHRLENVPRWLAIQSVVASTRWFPRSSPKTVGTAQAAKRIVFQWSRLPTLGKPWLHNPIWKTSDFPLVASFKLNW